MSYAQVHQTVWKPVNKYIQLTKVLSPYFLQFIEWGWVGCKDWCRKRGCYPQRLKAEVDNNLWGLHNSSHHTHVKVQFSNCFIIHSFPSSWQAYLLVDFLQHFGLHVCFLLLLRDRHMFFLADTTKKVDNIPVQYVLHIPPFFCSVFLRNSPILSLDSHEDIHCMCSSCKKQKIYWKSKVYMKSHPNDSLKNIVVFFGLAN